MRNGFLKILEFNYEGTQRAGNQLYSDSFGYCFTRPSVTPESNKHEGNATHQKSAESIDSDKVRGFMLQSRSKWPRFDW